MTETHAGPKRKWFYRMAAFAVLGVTVADKRTWKELKPLVANGLKADWQTKVAELMASKGVTATKPAPTPPPTTPPPTPRPEARPRPRQQAPRSQSGTTIAPTTPDAIRAQLAAASKRQRKVATAAASESITKDGVKELLAGEQQAA